MCLTIHSLRGLTVIDGDDETTALYKWYHELLESGYVTKRIWEQGIVYPCPDGLCCPAPDPDAERHLYSTNKLGYSSI